jgi:hypothetical protein
VHEVRVIAAPEVSAETTFDLRPGTYYCGKAHNHFLKMLGKTNATMSEEGRAAGQVYWEGFIYPYLETSIGSTTIESRIRQDLAEFLRLNVVYVDLQHDILDRSSPA